MYTSAIPFKGFKVYDISKPEPQSRPTLKGSIPSKTPVIEEWEEFTEVKKGHYYVEQNTIDAWRKKILREGQCPSTKLSTPTTIRKIIVKADSDAGKRTAECHIYALPQYYSLMRTWVNLMRKRVDFKWRGEGLGGMTLLCIETLLKPKREHVDIYEKQALLRAQHYRCNKCGEPMRLSLIHI